MQFSGASAERQTWKCRPQSIAQPRQQASPAQTREAAGLRGITRYAAVGAVTGLRQPEASAAWTGDRPAAVSKAASNSKSLMLSAPGARQDSRNAIRRRPIP